MVSYECIHNMMFILHVGLFYYLLGNIEPKLRSSLKCIQLIACVSTENVEKYDDSETFYPRRQYTLQGV